ncbi:MAG: ATP-binding protein [Planctomycetes bacterium]|nr:ATP-binding protein [Planctomycetota bacterium]
MSDRPLYPELQLPGEVVDTLRLMNPWWEGRPAKPLPTTERHLVAQLERRLRDRLAPIVVLRGPRQIGKTTAQQQLLQKLLARGVPAKSILRVQWDELGELQKLGKLESPILRVVEWYERNVLGRTLNQAAHDGQSTYVFFDEVQNLKHWSEQLKFLVDQHSTQVVVTGSSALRIERGRDSLAGRITTLEAGVLSLTEIARFRRIDLGQPFLADNGLEPLTRRDFWAELERHGRARATDRDRVFAWFSERGGYPLAHDRADIDWPKIADQLNETVIQRVIQHDLRLGDVGRKRDQQLLEELFRLVCRYAGQQPDRSLLRREIDRALHGNIGEQRVGNYLEFLGETLLVRLIEPLEIRLKKKRSAAKLCLSDHALRASWLQEIVPLAPDRLAMEPHLATLAGHIAESVVGACLSTITGLDISHVPDRKDQPELDFVITVGTKRIPIEVKYQRRIDPLRDTEGLRTFLENTSNNAPFGLLVTQSDGAEIPDPRIIALPLSSLMLLR